MLLADPLASKPPEWERHLGETDERDEKALLLRYGEQYSLDGRHPLINTVNIPSSLLHTHKIEILVHTVATIAEPSNETATSFVVPSLDIANSASGRRGVVTYPVHKALVYDEGLNTLGTLAVIGMRTGKEAASMFKGVVDWSWSSSQQHSNKEQQVYPINLALAESAVDVFRRSLDKAMDYEHMWFDAGMPEVSTWFLEGTETPSDVLKPTIRHLVSTVLNSTETAIQRQEASQLQRIKTGTVSDKSKKILDQGISIWAENAHTELRDKLNIAFNSKSWRRLKWWKLFWRVDDVTYITTDILDRTWLVDAEKEMIWIWGRIFQSGLLGPPRLRPLPPPEPKEEDEYGEQRSERLPPTPTLQDVVPSQINDITEFSEPPPRQHPWLQEIPRARRRMTRDTIPPLQSLAQISLLEAISTNVVASSLSVLIYLSLSTPSPYEAGAVAAFGLAYSLRRLQKQWETTTSEWQFELRENGRRVLRVVEEVARGSIRDGGRPKIDEAEIEERKKAVEAARRAREVLEEMKR